MSPSSYPWSTRFRCAGRRGHPRRRPDALYADRGYDYDTYRRDLRELSIRPIIARRGSQHGSAQHAA